MKSNQNKTLIVIAGPTAVGKTSLSIALAKTLQCEILSCDSRQLYRELDIGVAKPSIAELAEVKHHFINHLSFHDDYDVAQYRLDVIALLPQLFENSDVAIMVGGTGLFIKAVLHGIDNLPGKNDAIRAELNEQLHHNGLEFLVQRLHKLDPKIARTTPHDNPQRLIRAIEIAEQITPESLSHLPGIPYHSILIGLNDDRETLYRRINNRVDEMIKMGLKDEVRSLIAQKELNALRTVGYSEYFKHFEGDYSEERAIELIKRNTRRYAKRQLTWFRNQEDLKWFSPHSYHHVLDYIKTELKD